MGLRQRLSEWITVAKDTFDFGPEFPAAMAAHRLTFVEKLTELQHLLEQTRRAAQEKDELIARLQAAGAVKGNMVVDGSAYFIRKGHALEGPFCMACFRQNYETARLMPAPRPEGADGDDWVQCRKCGTMFQSQRISEFLNPRRTSPAQPEASAAENEGVTPAVPMRKPRAQNRRPSTRQAPRTRATARPATEPSQ